VGQGIAWEGWTRLRVWPELLADGDDHPQLITDRKFDSARGGGVAPGVGGLLILIGNLIPRGAAAWPRGWGVPRWAVARLRGWGGLRPRAVRIGGNTRAGLAGMEDAEVGLVDVVVLVEIGGGAGWVGDGHARAAVAGL
jgi:hypothetical protein